MSGSPDPAAGGRRAGRVCARAAIRGVLFDKDGTLIDFFSTWIPAYREAARELAAGDAALADRLLRIGGYDPATGALEPASPLASGTNAEIAALWAAEPALRGLADVSRRIRELFHAHATRAPVPITDVAGLFARLKARGLKLGVATSDSTAAAEATLQGFGALHLVDYVAGFDKGSGAKPGAGPVLEFCRAAGIPPPAVAVVGDSRSDLEMAASAGAGLAVGVASGVTPGPELRPYCDVLIASVAEIEGILG
jgi:phosphoglycolate phosphatase